MEEIKLTLDLFSSISKLKLSEQRKILRKIGEQEFSKCADDLLYWLDEKRHVVPYVYTEDQKPIYQCNLCEKAGIESFSYFHKLDTHLRVGHGVELDDDKSRRAYFTALPMVRPFPMKPYIEPIAKYWLQEQFIFLPKSRDMVATWQIVAYYTWDTIFHNNRQNFFQSENAPKANYLVKRAHSIWKNQPSFLRNVHKALYTVNNKSGRLYLPTLDSEIIGLAQGPDQIRMHHPSGVFMDEAAFQEKAGDTFSAIKPAIQNGGRFTAISSTAPGWFAQICEDKLLD